MLWQNGAKCISVIHYVKLVKHNYGCIKSLLTDYQTTNLDSSKLKKFADDNFKFDKNGRKLFKWVENTVGKG